MSRVLFVGDTHGCNNFLNSFPEFDYIIQLGDNGIFWNNQSYLKFLNPKKTKIYFLPGNHEDWNYIESNYGRRSLDPVVVKRNVYFCPIGSSITIDGKKIVFIGGADSIDKQYRIEGDSWFSQEILNSEDLKYISDNHDHIDIICSHTVPTDSIPYAIKKEANLISEEILQNIVDKYNPTDLYAGHWHTRKEFMSNNTKIHLLNKIDSNFTTVEWLTAGGLLEVQKL